VRSSHGSNDALTVALEDDSPVVRIAAADALAHHGDPGPALKVLTKELQSEDLDVALLACRTIELLGDDARSARRAMKAATTRFAQVEGDRAMFIRFSSGAFLARLGR
jgi:HEAT repeat protein